MTRTSKALARAAALAVLAGALQSSTCHAHYCSGDGCNDDEEEEGERTEMLVLPPLRDPLGRPLTSPIPILRRLDAPVLPDGDRAERGAGQ